MKRANDGLPLLVPKVTQCARGPVSVGLTERGSARPARRVAGLVTILVVAASGVSGTHRIIHHTVHTNGLVTVRTSVVITFSAFRH